MTERRPTDEELRLWEFITRHDEMLPHARIDWDAAIYKEPINNKPLSAGNLPDSPSAAVDISQLEGLLSRFSGAAMADKAEAVPAPVPMLDRQALRRLKQGKQAVEAALDLHGLGQEAAWQALVGFIGGAVARGKRCVLVITGKGKGAQGGVLRQQLPRWLGLAPCAGWVAAFGRAGAGHGGEGAFYVMLRRQR